MDKTLFNEAERYLIGNWPKARLLERSMQTVRNKYYALCQQVVEIVREKEPALDWDVVWVHRTSGEGGIGMAKQAWPEKGSYKLGLYVEGLRLEKLTAGAEDEEDLPYASIYTGPAPGAESPEAQVAKAVRSALRRHLTDDQRKRCKEEPGAPLWYYLPEKRDELVKMLMAGDGREFVECLSSHFDVLAKFCPDLDEALAKTRAKK